MATRGRKPTPTAIKELEGNPGKRPLNSNEPKPDATAPKCPKWLEPEAKKEWKRLSIEMERIGILTKVDMAAFAAYCHPQVSIAQTYMKIMEKLAEQFGLTPSSRSRIIAGNQEGNTDDEMEKILRGDK